MQNIVGRNVFAHVDMVHILEPFAFLNISLVSRYFVYIPAVKLLLETVPVYKNERFVIRITM